jgi:hypothetical protein
MAPRSDSAFLGRKPMAAYPVINATKKMVFSLKSEQSLPVQEQILDQIRLRFFGAQPPQIDGAFGSSSLTRSSSGATRTRRGLFRRDR